MDAWVSLRAIVEHNFRKLPRQEFIDKLKRLCALGNILYLLDDPVWIKRILSFGISLHGQIDTILSRDACLNSANSNEALYMLARNGYRFYSGFPGQQWINFYQEQLYLNRKKCIILLVIKKRGHLVYLDRFLLRELAKVIYVTA